MPGQPAVTVITLTADELRRIIREELEAAQRAAPVSAEPSTSILTTEEAAAYARRSPETIRAWIKSGRLRALPRTGRAHYQIRREDLERALEAPSTEPLDADAWAQGIIRSIG